MRFRIYMLSIFILCAHISCMSPSYRSPTPGKVAIRAEESNLYKENYRKLIVDLRDRQKKLFDLSWPLRLSSVGLSNNNHTDRYFGFYCLSMEDLNPDLERYKHEVLMEEYGIPYDKDVIKKYGVHYSTRSVIVWHVIKNSPAHRSNLRSGDIIKAINGEKIKSRENFNTMLKKSRKNKSTVFSVLRRADPIFARRTMLEIEISPVISLKFSVGLLNDNLINAYADGKRSYVTTGLMDFVKSDEELQFVIAHELSHNIADHIGKMKKNAYIGAIVGGALGGIVKHYTGVSDHTAHSIGYTGAEIGAFAYKKEFESEADYLGMYILARAGIETEHVHDFWRRFEDDKISPKYSFTHPTNPQRIISIILTHEEIQSKKKRGINLLPRK